MAALVPGLYVAVVLAIVVWVLGRYYDPVPRRPLLLFVAVVLVLFWRVLFAGGVLLPLDSLRDGAPYDRLPAPERPGFNLQSDLVEDFAPYYSQLRRSYRRLEWPLYNELVAAGEPFLANTQAQHLQPLILATLPLPLEQAAGALSALKVLQALLFTFLVCRRWGQSEVAASTAAVVYGLGGFLMMWLGWPHAHSAAALPLILYAVERVLGPFLRVDSRAERDSRLPRRDALLLGFAVFSLLSGGHPETVSYVAATVATYTVTRLWGLRRRPGELLSVTRRLAAPPVVAAGLCAVLLLPAALYLPQAARYVDVEMRRLGAASPWTALTRALVEEEARASFLDQLESRAVPVVAPFAFGAFGMRYWGAENTIEDNAAFVGTLSLLLALLALGPRSAGAPGLQRRLWIALGGFALLLLLRPPGLIEALAQIPAFGQSASGHRRAMLVFGFAVAVLAGVTLDRGLRRRRALVAALGVGVGLSLLVLWAYRSQPGPGDHLAVEVLRWRTIGIQISTVFLGIVILAWGRRRPSLLWLVPILVSVELLFVFSRFHPPMPRRLFFPSTPGIESLRESLGHQRFVALERAFRHNVPVLYGLADLRSGSPLRSWSFRELTRELHSAVEERMFAAPESPLYDLLGVRFVVTAPGVEIPELERVYQQELWIYRRSRPLDVLYLPFSVAPLSRDEWPRAVTSIRDHRERAMIAGDETLEPWRADDPSASRLEIDRLESARITATLDLAERRYLATSFFQDGGWRALVDGRKTETSLASGLFVGLWVPEGARSVELVYRPPGFLLGALVSALSAALALYWLGRPSPESEPSARGPKTLRAERAARVASTTAAASHHQG